MKNECDIVRDLLFSYNDGVLSETSKILVEEHLKTCKTCKRLPEGNAAHPSSVPSEVRDR